MQDARKHEIEEQVSDWKTALKYLQDGNRRYIEGNTLIGHVSGEDRHALKTMQKPFAVVVTCPDSRVSPEIFFDQNLGDIFVVRNAGSIADTTVEGSIEFAVKFLSVTLVVVIGHSNCAAVGAAFKGGNYSENLQKIINEITPAVKGCENVDEAILSNVHHAVNKIKSNETVMELNAKVLGAYYDIESGKVDFEI